METFTDKSRMAPRMVETLGQMMVSQAYRELAAARMFGHGLQFSPKLAWSKFITWHTSEEMGHFEVVARMYQRFTGQSVEGLVNDRLAAKPIDFSKSWFELAMAQFLYDRGGYWQLREYESCAFIPYREAVRRILAEEAGHQSFGERIVVNLCRSGQYEAVKQRDFEIWLRQGLLSFGKPNTPGSQFAVSVGLKRRDSSEVMQDFIDDIKPAVKKCGLKFPSLDSIGITASRELDLTV